MQHRLHPVTGRKCSHHQDAVVLLTVLDPLGYLTFKTSMTSSPQSNTNYDRHHYETFLFGIDHLSFEIMTNDLTQKELFSHNKPQTFILNKENEVMDFFYHLSDIEDFPSLCV